MAEFRMPSLGSDMEKGTLVEWLKKPGDPVAHGDIIAVIETEKGAIEIESFQTGTFERSLVDVGATVPVGTPIAIIGGGAAAPGPAPAPAPTGKPTPVEPAPAAKPVAQKPASKPVEPAPAAKPGAPPPAAARPAAPVPGVKVSPAARKLAAERGIDLATLQGSGPEGSIVYIDVEAALPARPQPAPPSAAPPVKRTTGIDLAAMRQVIAAATARAKREIPHYYLTHEVDITAMLAKLARINAKRTPDRRVLPAAVFVKALADALRKHPGFNGFYGDGAFRPAERVHVGVAIALRGGGLIAPAIHDTDKLAFDEVMAHLRDLVARVRAGRFRSSELSDPTITFTGLGDRGVDAVVPVIYPPQVAIAGAGTPRLRPWVVGGKVKARQVVTLSLAGDHRVGDGHQGAVFLASWAEFLQDAKRL